MIIMKIIKHLLIVPMLLLLSSSAFGQDWSPDFTIESLQFTLDGDTVTMESQIVKDGNSLTWTQIASGQQMATTYTVKNVSGNWDSVTNQGAQSYVLELNGFESLFTITSNTEGISVEMHFYEAGDVTEQYAFNVNSITYN